MNYEIYHIPTNFTDAGRVMGLFELRNLVETVILTVPVPHRKRQLPDPADQQGKWGTVFEMQRNSAGRRRRRSSVSSAGTGGRADHERKR